MSARHTSAPHFSTKEIKPGRGVLIIYVWVKTDHRGFCLAYFMILFMRYRSDEALLKEDKAWPIGIYNVYVFRLQLQTITRNLCVMALEHGIRRQHVKNFWTKEMFLFAKRAPQRKTSLICSLHGP